MNSYENMYFIVNKVKAIKSKKEEKEGYGWVKLEFSDIKGESETDWLPILNETASSDCGFWSLPEIGVQALACIFNGTKSGFVIGFLYDENHKPPVKGKASNRTVLQTKKHRFELIDEEGKEAISLSTSEGKMRVVITSDGGIEIANELDDGKIEIEASEELEIGGKNLIFEEEENSLESKKINIKTSSGMLLEAKKDFKVKGKNVKLNGSTGVTAKGKQIAKQDDKVIGLDIHILMVPSPSGAVPTPFPHPFIGALKEDLSESVKIGSNKVAIKNSVAKHTAGHTPMGPGTFQKNPENKGKVTNGTEKSVKATGKEVAVLGSQVTTCNDTGLQNNSMVVAVGMSLPVVKKTFEGFTYEWNWEEGKCEKKEEEKGQNAFEEKSEREQTLNKKLSTVIEIKDDNTKGVFVLNEEYEGVLTRYMPDGSSVVDFVNLPGSSGIKIPRRLTDFEMAFLTKEYEVEFAQIYQMGTGKNGSGGTYVLFSGVSNRVSINCIDKFTILINHTHPKGTCFPSDADMQLLKRLEILGSPQRSSQIIPIGKDSIRFDKNGKCEVLKKWKN